MTSVTKVTAMLLLGTLLGACAPRHGAAPPMSASGLWAPLPYKTVDVDGVTVAYVDSGGPGPVLLFVHGLSSYTSFWERQIPYFAAQGYRVLSIDLPGFGASDRPDAPLTPPWYATFLDRWLEGLGVERATVAGHSMGGQIALWLALSHPERVDRLVLSAPAGFERFRPGEVQWMKRYWHDKRALEADEDAVYANFRMNFAVWDEGVERLVEERVRLSNTDDFRGTSVAVARCVAGMLDHPVLDRLGEIKAPTLLVFGRDDRLIPNPIFHGGSAAALARSAQEAISGSELVLVSGAGHVVHHDRPDEFNSAVLDWLKTGG